MQQILRQSDIKATKFGDLNDTNDIEYVVRAIKQVEPFLATWRRQTIAETGRFPELEAMCVKRSAVATLWLA